MSKNWPINNSMNVDRDTHCMCTLLRQLLGEEHTIKDHIASCVEAYTLNVHATGNEKVYTLHNHTSDGWKETHLAYPEQGG